MATPLHRPVRRQLMSTDRKGRPLICTLEPGEIISFRPKGSKRSISVHLGFCAQLAQAYTVQSEYDKKMADYQAKKKMGLKRLRRPTRPFLPFGKIVLNSMR